MTDSDAEARLRRVEQLLTRLIFKMDQLEAQLDKMAQTLFQIPAGPNQ